MKHVFLILISMLFSSCLESEMKPVSYSPKPYSFTIPIGFDDVMVPTANPMTEEGVALGRMLFYEKRMSREDSISCATCHIQSMAFTDGRSFTPRMEGFKSTFNTPTLTNVAYSNMFRWEGLDHSLERQAVGPIVNVLEMDQRLAVLVDKLQQIEPYPNMFKEAFDTSTISITMISMALAQFQRTLISGNSRFDQYQRGNTSFSEKELLGLTLFSTAPVPEKGIRGAGCISCHGGFDLGGETKNFDNFKNNGLSSFPSGGLMEFTERVSDIGKFKVPTLRNIEVTAPYMHFGQLYSLEEVLQHYSSTIKYSSTLADELKVSNGKIGNSQFGLNLTMEEQQAIIAFLKTLTDEEFLNNSEFGNPIDD